ncbi:hypothetical protein F383_04688 [Gossypium arboreum]|uniref:Uncharacterized protein n=1 Tax=Gossypium arboreum TaxID=29729 RepID=A0A0B0P5C3_GOSAR|nr:hypothetical protein F383_11140 [Gossypium arboreum]KHG21933.1 hypothetical protein F383_04688 [Gossypium arboreum]
MACSFGLGVG